MNIQNDVLIYKTTRKMQLLQLQMVLFEEFQVRWKFHKQSTTCRLSEL